MRRALSLLLLLTALILLPLQGRAYSAAASQPMLTFAVLSDIHVTPTDGVAIQKFRAALYDIARVAPHAAVLVVNGDLGNGRPEDYRTLQKILAEAPHPPMRYTIGNHEYYRALLGAGGRAAFPNGETDAAAIQRFLAFAGRSQIYFAERFAGIPFIYLGSECSRMTNWEYGDSACLSASQLQWLEQTLAESHGTAAVTFLFLHQPLSGTVAGSAYPAYSHAVMQDKQLRALLSRYPEAVLFSGHSHWELKHPQTLVHQGFTMVNSSSVHSPSDVQDRPVPGASEGLLVEVYADRVVIRGRDFAHQCWVDSAQFSIAAARASAGS